MAPNWYHVDDKYELKQKRTTTEKKEGENTQSGSIES